MTLTKFVNKIFKEHFKIDDINNEFIKENFKIIRKLIVKSIKEKILNTIIDNNYDDYIELKEIYTVSLLDELTPFTSVKIKYNILFNYEKNNFFNDENIEDNYSYDIPDNVVQNVIEIKNKLKLKKNKEK
jgi:hypothetical protein